MGKKKSNKLQAREEEPKHPPAQVFKTQGKKLPKPKSNWRKIKRSPFPSESNPSMSITWTQTNLAAKLRNFGIPLSDLKLKSTILRKDKRGRTTTSKSSRKRKATSCRQGRRSQSIRRRRCSRRKERNDQNQRAIGGGEKDLPFHQNQTPRCR